MIVEERTAAYLRSLEQDMPPYLAGLEEQAITQGVPIIRKDAQALLRFLIRMRRPKRILEVGAAVGFSCMYMNEYLQEDGRIATIEKVPMRIGPAKKNLATAPFKERIALLVGEAADVLKDLADGGSEIKMAPRFYNMEGNGRELSSCGMAEDFAQGGDLSQRGIQEVYLPAGEASVWQDNAFGEKYDFIFMDAAKGQYMNFLPHILALLSEDGIFVTDNVLQEGSIAESKFAIPRRDRGIHMRMREYLYELTHREGLNTAVLPVGDGMSVTTCC